MKKIHFKFLILSFIITLTSEAQPFFNWAKGIGSSSSDSQSSITHDAQGNVYACGLFQSTIDLDPGPGTYTATANGLTDIYVVKLNPLGQFIWGHTLGSSGGENILSVVTATNGDVYLGCVFTGTIDANPGAAVQTFTTPNTNFDFFITKLNSLGGFIWAKQVSGLGSENITSLAVDNSNNLLIGGYFNGNTDFDPNPTTFTLQASGGIDGFISKWSSSGNMLWAVKVGGTSTGDEVNSVGVDALSNVFATGKFNGTADFDPGIGVYNLSGVNDAFVLKLDQNGLFNWANQLVGGSASDIGISVQVSTAGNVIAAGIYAGTIDVEPGPSITNLISNASSDDFFLVSYSNSGILNWGKSFGSSSNESEIGMDLDNLNNIALTGSYAGTMDINPGIGTNTVSNSGSLDIFVSKLDPSGNLLWHATMGTFAAERGKSITALTSDIYYIGGEYSMNFLDFDFGPGTATLTTNGSGDCFFLKISECAVPLSPLNTTSVSALNICTGQSTTLTASGTGTITWYSSPSATLTLATGTSFPTGTLSPGIYTYYLSSKTCVESPTLTSITVTSNITPTVNIIGGPICSGSSATLQALTADTYSWSTGATGSVIIVTPTANTIYSVVGTNTIGMCSKTTTYTQFVNPTPTLSITGNTIICLGNSTTLNISGADTYSWSNGSTNNNISVTPTVTTSYSVVGTYTSTDCFNNGSIIVNVSLCTGDIENEQLKSLEVLPNPNNGTIIIKTNLSDEFMIYNQLGQIMIHLNNKELIEKEFNVTNLSPGIYYLQSKSSKVTKKIIINN